MRDQLIDLLARWEAGEYDPETVRARADFICNAVDWETAPVPDVAVREACSQLEAMHIQLVTTEDIVPLRTLLQSHGKEEDAISGWVAYFEGVDLKARAERLADDSFYGDGARSILSRKTGSNLRRM